MNLVDPEGKLGAILGRYSAVFTEELGCVQRPSSEAPGSLKALNPSSISLDL